MRRGRRHARRGKTWFEHTFLPLLSFPFGVFALWAVGEGLFGIALFATFFGAYCLYEAAK